jgi:hypothetical protein
MTNTTSYRSSSHVTFEALENRRLLSGNSLQQFVQPVVQPISDAIDRFKQSISAQQEQTAKSPTQLISELQFNSELLGASD